MKPLRALYFFLATGAYSGLSPIAPGTAGSVVATGVWIVISNFRAPSLLEHTLLCFLLLICALLSTHQALKDNPGETDPGFIVIDEWIGMWITLGAATNSPFEIACAFFLFRFFDITKPSLVGRAESLPGAWGVVMDDVVAGIFALISLLALKELLPL